MDRVKRALQGVLTHMMMFFAFSFVGLAVIVAILWTEGYLSLAKLEHIGEILREDPATQRSKPAPEKASAEIQAQLEASRSSLERRETRWREEYDLLASALRTLREEGEIGRRELESGRAKLASEQEGLDARIEARRKLEQSEAFKNNVRIITKLAPKDAAAFVRDWTPEEIVAYVRRLRDKDAAKLLLELDKADAPKAKDVRTLLKEQAAAAAKK